MKLTHWSHKIVTEVKGTHQNEKMRGIGKPHGFWLSDESRGAYGWRSWCKAEGFRPYGFRYEHRVTLAPNAKILYLRSHEEIEVFSQEYKADTNLNRQMSKFGDSVYDIDWKRVAKKYHGIIITPYIWSQRLSNNNWYYAWDCASGCIWNKRAIQSIEMVKERKVPKAPTYWQRKRKHKRDMLRMAEASKEMVRAIRASGRVNGSEDALEQSADEIIKKYSR